MHGHVTDIWLNRCYAQAPHTKGHLTSIAGSNHRLIQLNLLAIYVCGSEWLSAGTTTAKPTQGRLKPSRPNDSPRGLSIELRETRVSVHKFCIERRLLKFRDVQEAVQSRTVLTKQRKKVWKNLRVKKNRITLEVQ